MRGKRTPEHDGHKKTGTAMRESARSQRGHGPLSLPIGRRDKGKTPKDGTYKTMALMDSSEMKRSSVVTCGWKQET